MSAFESFSFEALISVLYEARIDFVSSILSRSFFTRAVFFSSESRFSGFRKSAYQSSIPSRFSRLIVEAIFETGSLLIGSKLEY